MPAYKDLGDRMKQYEASARTLMVPRMPMIIRIDGRAFHTLTRNFDRPFDDRIMHAMNTAAYNLVNQVQGAILAYCQSDEISLLLQCDSSIQTQPWFGGKQQKIVSVSASIATGYFNDALLSVYQPVTGRPPIASFDARCFNIPWEDIPNYFVWRHEDCVKNSISSVALTYFSSKECHKKSSVKRLDMIASTGKPWSEYSDFQRNGMFFIPDNIGVTAQHGEPKGNMQSILDSEFNSGKQVYYYGLKELIRVLRELRGDG